MGDRANIRIKQSSGQLYLYGHWAGLELAYEFQQAFIRAKERWNDEAYCSAYCVGQILKGNRDSVTGYGLTCSRGDNERDCLEVDFPEEKIRLRSRKKWHDEGYDWEANAPTIKEWTFQEFADASEIHPEND